MVSLRPSIFDEPLLGPALRGLFLWQPETACRAYCGLRAAPMNQELLARSLYLREGQLSELKLTTHFVVRHTRKPPSRNILARSAWRAGVPMGAEDFWGIGKCISLIAYSTCFGQDVEVLEGELFAPIMFVLGSSQREPSVRSRPRLPRRPSQDVVEVVSCEDS